MERGAIPAPHTCSRLKRVPRRRQSAIVLVEFVCFGYLLFARRADEWAGPLGADRPGSYRVPSRHARNSPAPARNCAPWLRSRTRTSGRFPTAGVSACGARCGSNRRPGFLAGAGAPMALASSCGAIGCPPVCSNSICACAVCRERLKVVVTRRDPAAAPVRAHAIGAGPHGLPDRRMRADGRRAASVR